MARLTTYRKKRDFAKTPEPPPEAAPERTGAGALFMIHKHDATRLHYDVRLEIDGALASWAVPKGPSYDPAERRLAVETEDHPLAYGSFEGRIPDGEYGAGDSIIWDRGTWDTVPPGQAEAQRKKGHLVFTLDGEKLKGRWHLVRTRASGAKAQWLFFKGRDEHADPKRDVVVERPESVVTGKRVTRGPVRKAKREAKHPEPLDLLLAVWPPMLATLSSEAAVAPREADYLFETKYDGFRALAGVSGRRVSLQSRNGLDLAQRFPTVAAALAALDVPECVIDGEIVALEEGVARFQNLQESTGDVELVAFDLLWLDGEDLRERPLEERRDLLASVVGEVWHSNREPASGRGKARGKRPAAARIVLAERVDGPLDAALAHAKEAASEGLIAKRRGSVYRGGRGRDWLKLKLITGQELAIVGYVPISNGKPQVGALLVAAAEGRRLRYAGKVGTGFTDATRRSLWKSLEAERIEAPAFDGAPRERGARWVTPRLVAEVAFTEWTRDGKLRHPRFLGLRPDKTPSECKVERPG